VSDKDHSTQLRIASLELHKIQFEILDPSLAEDEDLDARLGFGLSVARPSVNSLGVEYGVQIAENPAFRMEIAYRATFERVPPFGEGEDQQKFWRVVAARMAPTVIYPYIRETATTLFAKAGFPPSLMPVLQVGAMFEPEDTDIPDPPPEGEREH
jgi:preprotein translocase subunit SecB